MKKISAFPLLLCLLLLVQSLTLPALATAATETAAPTETQAPLEVEKVPVPEVAYGAASITNGCRTLDGQIALGGDDKLLETAKAAFVYEKTTGTIIYNYHPDTPVSPGALTKILTAIIAIENSDLDDNVTVSTNGYSAIAGTRNSALKNGEIMTMNDLLHCMMLQLANDAAISIAEYISGSESNFVRLMNETAKVIGCENTAFVNCHGLDASGQQSTARDMAKILQYALRNHTFREIFACKVHDVPATNLSDAREVKTLNHLVGAGAMKFNYDGVTGGLGTYAAASGASIACTVEKNDMSLVCVLLGAQRKYNGNAVVYYGNYEEIWDLMDFGLDNFKICRLLHDGQTMNQFPVAGGENAVVGWNATDMDAVLPESVNMEDLTLKYSVEGGGLKAPVAQDQRVSTLQIWCGGSCVAETELYAMTAVHALSENRIQIQSAAIRDDSDLKGFLSFVGIVFLVVLTAAIAYITIRNVRISIARKRRRREREMRRRRR